MVYTCSLPNYDPCSVSLNHLSLHQKVSFLPATDLWKTIQTKLRSIYKQKQSEWRQISIQFLLEQCKLWKKNALEYAQSTSFQIDELLCVFPSPCSDFLSCCLLSLHAFAYTAISQSGDRGEQFPMTPQEHGKTKTKTTPYPQKTLVALMIQRKVIYL